MQLNVAAIEAAQVPAGRRDVLIYDTLTPHLAVLITAKGHRAFYWYGRVSNRPAKSCIGKFPEWSVDRARRRASEITAEGHSGVHPNEDRRQLRGATLADAWNAFEADHVNPKLRPRTATTYADLWEYDLKPWGTRAAGTLTEADVIEMHRKITASNGPVTANRAMAMLRKMLTWSRLPNPIRPGVIDWNEERPRERHLSTDEMHRLMRAIDKAQDRDIADFLKIALFTGARRSNVLAMEWKEIDVAAKRWQIPGAKAKGKIPVVLNLSPAIVEILHRRQKAQRRKNTPYVFPGAGDTGHMVEPKRAWTSIRKAAKITDVTLHDLRRTLASWMAQSGMTLLEIGKALGHTSPAATSRYAHLVVGTIAPGLNAVVDSMIAAGNAKPAKERRK